MLTKNKTNRWCRRDILSISVYSHRCVLHDIQSTNGISKLRGLFFTSSNYPKCKLICTSRKFGLVKRSPTPKYGSKKQSKCNFESEKRFEFRRIRDIRVRDIESRLYIKAQIRFVKTTSIDNNCFISSPNPMFDHL